MRLFPPAAAQGEQGESRQAEGGSGGLGDGLEDCPITHIGIVGFILSESSGSTR